MDKEKVDPPVRKDLVCNSHQIKRKKVGGRREVVYSQELKIQKELKPKQQHLN